MSVAQQSFNVEQAWLSGNRQMSAWQHSAQLPSQSQRHGQLKNKKTSHDSLSGTII